MEALERLYRAMMGLVGRARMTRVDDTGPVQRTQVKWGPEGGDGAMGIKDSVPSLAQYGHASHPPIGSDAVLLFMGGDPTDAVVIATGHQASRLKDLLEGESALYNGLTGKSLRMAQDGKAYLDCDIIIEGVSFADLVAAYLGHKHTAVQAGGGVSGGTDTPL